MHVSMFCRLILDVQVLKDIETGQSRRMGYVTFEDGRALTEAIEEMHDAVCCCCAFLQSCAPHTCTQNRVNGMHVRVP